MPVLFSYALDPETPNPSLSGDEITTMLRDDRLAWVHLDMTAHGVEDWLNENMDYLGAPVINALLAAETRPRVTFQPNGVLLILRGINLNQGAEPEDMVSIRLWVDEHRIVSLQRRNLRAVTALVDQIKAQQGPKTSAEFLDRLLGALLVSTAQEIERAAETVDNIEDEIENGISVSLRESLASQRRKNIILQRFMRPQRDVVHSLGTTDISWIDQQTRRSLIEHFQAYLRITEDLDMLTEQLRIVAEEFSKMTSDRLNGTMYRLSIISAIFLPLGFLTGLFGVNIGGVPGTAFPYAFSIFCGILICIVIAQIVLIWRLKWL